MSMLLAAGLLLSAGGSGLYRSHHENVLGTSLELKIAARSEREAARAEAAALAEIDRLARILSAWDPASEFSRWNATRGRATRVSPELFETLSLFEQWRARTGGALNAGAESIGRVWRSAAQQKRLPGAAELATAVKQAGELHWRLDAAARTATRLGSAPIALNSLAKSYIVDRAASAAGAAGADGVVVNIGGDLAIRGAITEDVAIADPRGGADNAAPLARLRLRDLAVASSGSYQRGFDIAGRHYSHIVDPRTGRTADAIIGATVVAPDAAEAGALATAFSVLTPEQTQRVAATRPGVEYLLIAASGRRISSAGWHHLPLVPLAQAAAASGVEVGIQFTLARINDPRYRRPYVAVWVEDKDRFPVRTLALWTEKPRWLPDLKAWYRSDRLRALAEGVDLTASITSATRPPGKYSLKWDGKDQTGKAVKPGRYTVAIEAAREHGTYQILRQEIDLSGASQQFTLPGNPEIESATLDFHKAVAAR